MGDQVGAAVSGTLCYVPASEFERVRSMQVPEEGRVRLFAALCRINALYMIARAGSGHIGSSFSSLDIISWLLLNEANTPPSESVQGDGAVFFSSKGHDAPALYSAYIGLGWLDFGLLHRLRRLGGLPGHPDVGTPNIVANTGSLGMGVSKAKGMIYANRRLGRHGEIFVLTGDGELQEGQFWESLISAANHGLHELIVIVDHNKLQSDTLVAKVSDLGDLEAKLAAFGWEVARCDGNEVAQFRRALADVRKATTRPKVIIADTVKGRGVSFMEHTSIDSDVELYKFHSGAPSAEAYTAAASELVQSANEDLDALGAGPLQLESVVRPPAPVTGEMQRLIPAYTRALLDQAARNERIVALDADLVLDTGLIPFREQFPDRFIECGIAEQDMVSQAGGMALRGLLPVVHSFACFLTSRANEQIYNNATERTRVIYVGSLAGVVPAGPGHSHQAVRDISSLAAVPGLVAVEPSCEAEVGPLLDWCVNAAGGSCYLRLTSLPWMVPFQLPADYRPQAGRGVTVEEGDEVAIIAYGPVMLSCAVEAARQLRVTGRAKPRVINLPWLNCLDAHWLRRALEGCRTVHSIDNQYVIGGQGDRIAAALAGGAAPGVSLHRVALTDVPLCGTNLEILQAHGLDSDSLVRSVLQQLQS